MDNIFLSATCIKRLCPRTSYLLIIYQLLLNAGSQRHPDDMCRLNGAPKSRPDTLSILCVF